MSHDFPDYSLQKNLFPMVFLGVTELLKVELQFRVGLRSESYVVSLCLLQLLLFRGFFVFCCVFDVVCIFVFLLVFADRPPFVVICVV